jgi:hypothetical protein
VTMTNQELIEVLRTRLSYLSGQMGTAVAIGDVNQITSIQADIAKVEADIVALQAEG